MDKFINLDDSIYFNHLIIIGYYRETMPREIIIFDIVTIILVYYKENSNNLDLYLKQLLSLFEDNATLPAHEFNNWLNIISNHGIMINYQKQTIFQQFPTIIDEHEQIWPYYRPMREIFNNTFSNSVDLPHATFTPFIYNETHCFKITYQYYKLRSILLECIWIQVWGI